MRDSRGSRITTIVGSRIALSRLHGVVGAEVVAATSWADNICKRVNNILHNKRVNCFLCSNKASNSPLSNKASNSPRISRANSSLRSSPVASL